MVVLLICSFVVALVSIVFVVRLAKRYAKYYNHAKPQRFHAGNVPRLGGLGILAGLVAGWLVADWGSVFGMQLNIQADTAPAWKWVVVIIPAVAGGILEDMTQGLSVKCRLTLTALSAGLACGLLGLAIQRIGVPAVDNWMGAIPLAGVALAFIAICGLPHAFNLIDGYNGLAGSVALMVCVAISHVALQLGDRQLAATVICLVGATAGFLFWNYPRGLIFAGDGGAYLWGVVIAISSIWIVQRHSMVSPWFPLLLLIYPVWETIFSIYRKLVRGVSPGVADALHLHQLIYRRIVRGVFHDEASRRMLMRNNRTSPYLWGFTLLTVVPAVLFWNNTLILMVFCALFVICYVLAYLAIIRFKIPRWLRR